jgi:hypothetical protein
MRIFLLFFGFLFFALSAFANELTLSGSYGLTYKVYASYNIPVVSQSDVVVSLLQPLSGKPNVFETIDVSNFYIRYNTRPMSVKTNATSDGINIFDITFSPKKLGVGFNTMSFEVSYLVKQRIELASLNWKETFPYLNWEVPDEVKPYLGYSNEVSTEPTKVQAQSKQLTLRATSLFQATKQILSYVASIPLVSVSNHTALLKNGQALPYYQAKEVIEKNQASYFGKLNLAASLFRAAKIPVRFVRGVRIEKNVALSQSNELPLLFCYAQEPTFWLEIWTPTYEWLPLQISETTFFILPPYLRQESSPSLKTLLTGSHFKNDPSERVVEIISEDKNTLAIDLSVKSDTIWQTPVFTNNKPVTNFSLFKPLVSSNEKFSPYKSSKLLSLTELPPVDSLKITANPNALMPMEQFHLTNAVSLSAIDLMLYRLVDYAGAVKLSLYKKNENGSLSLIADSEAIAVYLMGVPEVFYWNRFNFKSIELSAGDYVMVPKLSGPSEVTWAYSPIQNLENASATFSDKYLKPKYRLPGQFYFQLILKPSAATN